MHHHAFYDTNVAVSYGQPELVYRSRGPPLSMLHNSTILARSRNFMVEMQREHPKYEMVNSLARIALGRDVVGVVAPCGFNHTELEVVCVGGQPSFFCHLRGRESEIGGSEVVPGKATESSASPSSRLSQCLSDILLAEYPSRAAGGPGRHETSGAVGEHLDEETRNYEACHRTAELDNGREPIYRKTFRFKRVSHIRPRSFLTDRVSEVRVDDKMKDRPFIYARNHHGCVLARLNVKEWDTAQPATMSRLSKSSTGAPEEPFRCGNQNDVFPSVVPRVIADMPFALDNTMTSMFVSPHDYGIWGTTTKKRQLAVWDSTISAPCAKVDLFKSSEKHLSYGEMYNKWYGCVASDTLECGTFTDRHDVILVAGSKVYMADLRTRSLGFVFPTHNVRPPSTYRFPKLNTRLPISDRFLAIERHPNSPSLYALLSGVSSSVLLWDIRYPSEVIAELPLPLLRQGRGRYRSLQWHHVPSRCAPHQDPDFYFLSAFSWEHGSATVNALSVLDSSSVVPYVHNRESYIRGAAGRPRQRAACGTSTATESPSVRDLVPRDQQEDASSFSRQTSSAGTFSSAYTRRFSCSSPGRAQGRSSQSSQQARGGIEPTEFWSRYAADLPLSRSPFFVNPFQLYPAPSNSPLPVCDPSGLCFSSSRPPLQVVVHQQAQVPIGVPTASSEQRYFAPLGPILTCSQTLINEGLHASLAEAPLSQLFHGLAGVQVLTVDVPNSATGRMEEASIVLGLSFSGRLTAARLRAKPRKRQVLLPTGAMSEEEKRLTSPLQRDLSASLSFPVTSRSQRPGVLPHVDVIHNLLFKKQHGSSYADSPVEAASERRVGWDPVPTDTLLELEKLGCSSRLGSDLTMSDASFFFSDVNDKLKYYNLRGLHELLRPNNDSLDHRTFLISPKMNFTRQRAETALFWRRPDLNGIYFPEALLDMLLSSAGARKRSTVALPVELPTVASDSTKAVAAPATTAPTPWSSVAEMLSTLLPSDAAQERPQAVTLGELMIRCSERVTRAEVLQALQERIASCDIVCWISATAGLDQTAVELLPFATGKGRLVWRGVPDRIATPLCSCASILQWKPLHLAASDDASQSSLWISWAPKQERLVFTNLVRELVRLTRGSPLRVGDRCREEKRKSKDNSQSGTMHDSTLRKLAKALIGNGISAVLLPSESSNTAQPPSVAPACDLHHSKSSTVCTLPHVLVLQSTLASGPPNITESVVQGKRFIAVDPETLSKASAREQQFILENSPREYPAYYAFLTGVRVTKHLYHNLQKDWPSRAPVAPSSSQLLFRQCLHPNERQLSVSSMSVLPYHATTAVSDAARSAKTRDHEAIVGALASHMKQPIGRRSLAAVLSGYTANNSRPSQSLSATLQRFSQDIEESINYP